MIFLFSHNLLVVLFLPPLFEVKQSIDRQVVFAAIEVSREIYGYFPTLKDQPSTRSHASNHGLAYLFYRVCLCRSAEGYRELQLVNLDEMSLIAEEYLAVASGVKYQLVLASVLKGTLALDV